MLKKGLNLEVISEITGLTPEQIEALRKDENSVKEPAVPYKNGKKLKRPPSRLKKQKRSLPT